MNQFSPDPPQDNNPFRDNPYSTPAPTGPGGPADGVSQPFNKVNQVRIFAILNGVQAGLELLMGLALGGFAVILPRQLANEMQRDPNFERIGVDPGMMMLIIYGGMAAAMLIVAVLRIIASLRVYQFRSRIFAIVSLVLGLSTVLTCYCSVTAVGLLIYGLIVLLDYGVVEAFRMRKEGADVVQILGRFSSRS